jgi:hypothetical protein
VNDDRIISIAREFSLYPAGRTRRDGPFSAEQFRDELLVPALRTAIAQESHVVVLLDDVYGYSSSFLEETFGGIVRANIAAPDILGRTLVIRAKDPIYEGVKLDAERYFKEASLRAA